MNIKLSLDIQITNSYIDPFTPHNFETILLFHYVPNMQNRFYAYKKKSPTTPVVPKTIEPAKTKTAAPLTTYLGPKGYTLLKSELSVSQVKLIQKELTVKPQVPGSPVHSFLDNSYPAYRETAQKYYLPRYFAEPHFGAPQEIRIPDGDPIDLTFGAELRDYQVPVVNKFVDYLKHAPGGSASGLLELPCAWGKTAAALYIIAAMKKKTIVLVHKEFLMNQWIERIGQFLPGARIGKIQGPTIDIEGKDVVIGMIQSLSMKEYPADIFASFGFAIIDEVHHISSEVFSNTLFKLVPKYMLGLSATMNRKDGTTHVFKMFLGPVVFKGQREEEYTVTVRAIEYKVLGDPEYDEVPVDFRGNTQYSTMIVKLCAANHRSEFILRVLADMMHENPKQQIIVLAHNKSLLKYLYDAIEHRQFATVGYYVGGMKEPALKASETKSIIIATYSMAAEALDIKTLTTLVMATPKTDIEQSVGRILRERGGQPVVVDIVDSHDVFQRQWAKRRVFYKKQNYRILKTSNAAYTPDVPSWPTIFSPLVKGCLGATDKPSNKPSGATDKPSNNPSNKPLASSRPPDVPESVYASMKKGCTSLEDALAYASKPGLKKNVLPYFQELEEEQSADALEEQSADALEDVKGPNKDLLKGKCLLNISKKNMCV